MHRFLALATLNPPPNTISPFKPMFLRMISKEVPALVCMENCFLMKNKMHRNPKDKCILWSLLFCFFNFFFESQKEGQ